MKLYEFWQQTFLAAVKSGQSPSFAQMTADELLRAFKARFEMQQVDVDAWDWREKQP